MLVLCQGKSHKDFTDLHEIKTKKTFCNILFYKFPPNNEYFSFSTIKVVLVRQK